MTIATTDLGPVFFDDRGAADAPTALLWPSLFTDHSMWDAQVAALNGSGWRTLAIDPPGHGRSPGPDCALTMDACAGAALRVLDTAGVRRPAVVLGTSWGGFVAPRVALRAPGRVRAMVLFNTSADRPMPSQRLKATLLLKLLPFAAMDGTVDRLNLSTLLASRTRRHRPEIGAALVERYRGWDRGQLIATVRSVLLDRDPIVDALPRIGVPTLVVSGIEDAILPPKLGRRIAEAIPKARHVAVPEAAHLVPLDAPDAAGRLILDFLSSLGALG